MASDTTLFGLEGRKALIIGGGSIVTFWKPH